MQMLLEDDLPPEWLVQVFYYPNSTYKQIIYRFRLLNPLASGFRLNPAYQNISMSLRVLGITETLLKEFRN